MSDLVLSHNSEQHKVPRAPRLAAGLAKLRRRLPWLNSLGKAARAQVSRPAIIGQRRPKIAVLSPIPPDRSGVAHFTAASLPELSRRAEIHVFTGTDRPHLIPGAASINPLANLRSAALGFDRVIGIMGNSRFHVRIFENLVGSGGACILHDSRLANLYCRSLGMERALQQAGRELGRPVSRQEIDSWLSDENRLETLFLGELAAACDPLFLHSKGATRIVRERYGIDPVYLPFAIYRPWEPEALTPSARSKARDKLGIAADEIVIATFGLVHATKGPEACIEALKLLRDGASKRACILSAAPPET